MLPHAPKFKWTSSQVRKPLQICAFLFTAPKFDFRVGEFQILRNDILFDCGVSLNPAVDIGQIIGAFTMGMGYHLMEELIIDMVNNPGQLISNGTWEYKIPSSMDIPIDWRVALLKNSTNPMGVSHCMNPAYTQDIRI